MYEELVALTGIEPAGRQFSSVQLGLSSCVFGSVQFATRAFSAVRMADVLPRCCPAARIRFAQDPMLAAGNGARCSISGHIEAHLSSGLKNAADAAIQTGSGKLYSKTSFSGELFGRNCV